MNTTKTTLENLLTHSSRIIRQRTTSILRNSKNKSKKTIPNIQRISSLLSLKLIYPVECYMGSGYETSVNQSRCRIEFIELTQYLCDLQGIRVRRHLSKNLGPPIQHFTHNTNLSTKLTKKYEQHNTNNNNNIHNTIYTINNIHNTFLFL